MRIIVVGSAVVLASVRLGTIAAAEPQLHEPRTASDYEFVAATTTPTPDHITFARQLLPATGATNALAQSRVIYLNRGGAMLRPGNNDARTNVSSIVNRTVQVPAWNTSTQTWAATVACFRDLFKDFDVVITDVDPGNVPHMEAIFGGSPQTVGMPSGVGGVSPFTQDCAVIENSIVFTFTDVFPNNAQVICEVMAQEVAHSYGLDHERLASDPMTYMSFNGKRTFKDQLVSCGEFSDRPCGIGGSVCRNKQNSVALLKERLGTADLVAPTLGITFPADNATVPPGFEVSATASDNIAVTTATLFIDDQPAGTIAGPGPYAFPTEPSVADGTHEIRVEVSDGRNTQSQAITVNVMKGADPDGGSGSGSGSGSGEGEGEDDGGSTGGCSTTGGGGLTFALAVLALRRRRRAR